MEEQKKQISDTENAERLARIRAREADLDLVTSFLGNAGEESPSYKDEAGAAQRLRDYYESGLWLSDYEADEAGKLPEDLRRGVLAQDTLYDLLAEWDRRAAKKRGIIFDLDGTLLDTIADLTVSLNAALLAFGCPVYSEEEVKRLVGNGFVSTVDRAVPADLFPDEEERAGVKRAVLAEFAAYYKKHFMDLTRPYPGIAALLSDLSARGVRLAVNSNKRDAYTKELIAKNFPDIVFTEVIGESEQFGKKPDPAAALYIAKKMGLRPEEIIYAGDSAYDMKTAENAGMLPVGVAWGYRSEEELRAAGAKKIVRSAAELGELF